MMEDVVEEEMSVEPISSSNVSGSMSKSEETTTMTMTAANQDDQMNVCRVCLEQASSMRGLFHEDGLPTLADRLMTLASVKMMQGDGLPSRICSECGDKVDTAYKFKLQVEQSDAVLRQKLVSIAIKEELLLNELDVNLSGIENNDEATPDDNLLLKDKMDSSNVEKEHDKEQMQVENVEEEKEETKMELDLEKQENEKERHEEINEGEEKIEETIDGEATEQKTEDEGSKEITADKNTENNQDTIDQRKISEESNESQQLPTLEHDYMETESCNNKEDAKHDEGKENVDEKLTKQVRVVVKKESLPCESTRRSERNLARQKSPECTPFDEETYFENLNLSSRLKRMQSEKSEKVFYVCYWCDERYSSRELLREHMYSHDEVRKTMSIASKSMERARRIPEKPATLSTPVTDRAKPPSSGKKSNVCPRCGKEYLYIISFKKHMKQHRKEDKAMKENSMPLEVSVHEDDDTLDLHDYDDIRANDSDSDGEEELDVKHEKILNEKKDGVEESALTEQEAEKDSSDTSSENVESAQKVKSSQRHSCPHCPFAFKEKNALAVHLKCHNVYDKITTSVSKSKENASQPRNYPCSDCVKCFTNELTLRSHLIATGHKTTIQGEQYDLNKRIKRVAAKAALKVIDKIKTDLSFEESDEEGKKGAKDGEAGVDVVKEKMNIKEEDEEEEYLPSEAKRMLKSPKVMFCATCNQKCTSKQALAKHMEQHSKDKNGVKRGKPESGEVEDDDDYEGGIDDWPVVSHDCPTCNKKYNSKKSLLRHQLLHEEPNFECDICNSKFYRKDKLKAHYDKCSERNPDQVRKCNICNDVFETNEALKQHRVKHVAEGILTEEDLLEIDPRPEGRGETKLPRKRRTDVVGLECQECNKRYTSRKGLLRHLQVHEGKRFLCDMCPKKFYRREHLKIHVAKHNIVKPYKCSKCSKRFIKEELLKNHLMKHEKTILRKSKFESVGGADGGKRFLCEICSKSFTQSTTLVAHLRAHNGIKPYVCDVCSRPFTTNAYLKMHMRTHTQERPYICQYCSRAFARADTLANHLTSHTGEAKYHCHFCPKNFRRLKSLKEHVFIHTGQRPYACPTCDRRFNNNGSRYAHSKRCKQNSQQPNRQQQQNQSDSTEQQEQQVQGQQGEQQQQQEQQEVQSQPRLVITTTGENEQGEQQLQLVEHVEAMDVQAIAQHGVVQRLGAVTTTSAGQIIKPQNIKTITIARPVDAGTLGQEILMPLILPFTVTLGEEEVILSEGTKIFTTT